MQFSPFVEMAGRTDLLEKAHLHDRQGRRKVSEKSSPILSQTAPDHYITCSSVYFLNFLPVQV